MSPYSYHDLRGNDTDNTSHSDFVGLPLDAASIAIVTMYSSGATPFVGDTFEILILE